MDLGDRTLKLSALDQIMPRAYMPFPLTFTIQAGDVALALATLSQAFEQLVSEMEMLKGHVVPAMRKGELEVKLATDAPSPRLIVRDFAGDNESSNLKDLLDGGASVKDAGAPVIAAQVNQVQGRIVLCICLHHSVMDGMGVAAVIRRWAERCRTFSRGMSAAPLEEACLDRGAIVHGGRPNAKLDHPSYSISHKTGTENTEEPPTKLSEEPRMIGRCFLLNREQTANTKAAFHQIFQSQNLDGTWISTNNILCTILWHAITRARLAGGRALEGKRSRLGVPVNVRSKMVPPLPPNYVGNATVDATAERSIVALATWTITEMALTARSIRQAISSVDETYIRALIDVVDSLEDASSIKPSRTAFLGDDVTITSLLDMGIFEMDWGERLGKIEETTPNFDGFDGLCVVLPRRRDGSIKIIVGLEEKAMNRMENDEEFQKYMEIVD